MPLNKDHYINLKNGKFDSTSREDLDHLFANFSSDQSRNTLVVHFHGGLVGEKAGMAVAEHLLPVYQSAGGYPVFFVWESGFMEVLTHNMEEISREKIFQILLRRATQFVVAKLKQPEGARASGNLELPTEWDVDDEIGKLKIGEAPYSDLDGTTLPVDEVLRGMEEKQFRQGIEREITAEANGIAASFRTIQDISSEHETTRGVSVRGSTHTLMSPDVIEEVRREAQASGETRGVVMSAFIVKRAISALKNVIVRFARGRSHGVYATIIEEILRAFYISNVGEFVWSQMKQDTEDAFQNDPKIYGGTAFLECVKAHWLSGGHPRIVLVGHSTGAVYICNLLKHAQECLPPDVKFDVVFLAPACTFDLLSSTLQTSAGRLDHIRIFTMKDTLEKANQLVPVIYLHSLLYFISGILEKEADIPILGMQRFYSGTAPFDASAFPHVDRVRTFLLQNQANTVWSEENSGPGRVSRSARHTDFDEDTDTLSSLQYIISHGF